MNIVAGQWWQRLLAILLGAGTIWLVLRRDDYGIPAAVLWVAGLAFVLFVLLSAPPLYRRWMAFAEWLSIWVTRVLFSAIYVLVVPFIRILYGVFGARRRPASGETFWIPKRPRDCSIADMERMG